MDGSAVFDMTVFDEPTSLVVPGLADFRAVSGFARDELFMCVERVSRRLEALKAVMLGEVKSSLSFLDDHHHNPQSWFRAVTNTTSGAAKVAVRIADLLAAHPSFALAFAAGEIGTQHVKALAGLYANEHCRDHLGVAEHELLNAAKKLTFREFVVCCDRFTAHADSDGTIKDHALAREHRKATFVTLGKGFILRIEGDALTGEILHDVLAAHADAEYANDVAERLSKYGDEAKNHPLRRTATQRVFDAVQTIFAKAASTRDIADLIPIVNVVCTEATLAGAARDFFGAPGVPDKHSWREHLCETTDGRPVSPYDLIVAALLGNVRRVITDSVGRVIDLGRKSRVFTGAAREAVLLTGDRCTWPGCHTRTGSIQIDHLQPWARTAGLTNPINGGPCCPIHNRAKHNAGITVIRDETGWHHYRPDGTEIAPRQQPPSGHQPPPRQQPPPEAA